MMTKINQKLKTTRFMAAMITALFILPVAGLLIAPSATETANAATDCQAEYIAYKKSGKNTGIAHEKWKSCLNTQAAEWCSDASRWQAGTQSEQYKKDACISWYIDGMSKPRDSVCQASRDPSGNNQKTCEEAARISLRYADAYEASKAGGDSFTGAAGNAQNSTDPDNNPVPQKNLKDSEDPALKCAAGDTSNTDCDLVKKYLNPIIGFLSAFVGIAVTIGIISGGIRYASASDDPQKAAAGRQMIRNALIALVAYIFLYAAIKWLLPQVSN